MYHIIRQEFRTKYYFYLPFLGLLVSRRRKSGKPERCRKLAVHEKSQKAMASIINPFTITPTPKSCIASIEIQRWVKAYAYALVWLYRHFYFGLYLASHLRFNKFENSVIATDIFCRILKAENQDLLCLPRSIFAATTSKRFKNEGAMFIGVFLPSRQMHAWVIEDQCNSWRDDAIWINYTPVSILLWR